METAPARRRHTSQGKAPFRIERALELVEKAVHGLPKAALFELYDRGHRSVFEQLVACIISIRTLDETTLVVATRLFAAAPSPRAVAALDEPALTRLLKPATFADNKARQIRAIAQATVARHGGTLPCDEGVLRSFSGVGPKCAALVLGIACGTPHIGVDIHVHRVTNRWGYVAEPTPEKTMVALERILPKRHWIDLNRLLVPFGKHVCTGRAPHCSDCPVRGMCRQVGVTTSR
jgi:endonuclease-3